MDGFKLIKPYPGLIIKENVKFIPGEYDFKGKDGLIIGADNVIIDGNGAVLKGGFKEDFILKKESNCEDFSYKKVDNKYTNDSLNFYGTGIIADGFSGICIKNLKVKGFDIGLHVKNAEKWIITNNDFSDNYTNPEWGWDDHGFHGGILLEHVNESIIKGNKANNVWDGINLRYCNKNTIIDNDFSHVSDVCLKLWNSSYNVINDNDLSYGIRISPGEVHARDSSGVLIESGSNYNIFKRNNITHGGDGIFIRVLNGWMSCGNYFEENDCSYANNNAIEAWAFGNIYVRNKANYSSYGFWLGGSDNTILIENEVAFNGTIFNNAPESFGNAGIAIVNGSGSHIKMIGNYIHDNNGPGVAIRYNVDYPSFHWVIQKNKIINNRNYKNFKGHGIYLKNARWIYIAGNEIKNNEGEPIFCDENTSDIIIKEAKIDDSIPEVSIDLDKKSIEVNEEITFKVKCNNSLNEKIEYRWDLGDGTIAVGDVIRHKYKKPGFYRMGVTASNGKMADIAFKNIYVNCKGEEIGTDDNANNWTYIGDDENAFISDDIVNYVCGKHSISLFASKGKCHILRYPKNLNWGMDISDMNYMTFYIKFHSDSETDWDRTNKKPIIRLYTSKDDYYEYKPLDAYLEQIFSKLWEEKYDWKFFKIHLKSPTGWVVNKYGNPDFKFINYVEIEEGPYKDSISHFWIDGLKFIQENEEYIGTNIAKNIWKEGYPKPIYSSKSKECEEWAPLLEDNDFYGNKTRRWFPEKGDNLQWFGIDFGVKREFNMIDIYFYNNPSEIYNGIYQVTPFDYKVEYYYENKWIEVEYITKESPLPNLNRVTFEKVLSTKIRIILSNKNGFVSSIYKFSVYNTKNIAGEYDKNKELKVRISASYINEVDINKIGILLNKECNYNGIQISNLLVRLYKTEGSLPSGDFIKEVEIPKDDIKIGKETIINFNCSGLLPNKKYALVLTQKNIAKSRTEGDYYRWITAHTDYNEHFGVINENEVKDETNTWGTAWMKIYMPWSVLDYSHKCEGLGVRFGLKEHECRWQTFTLKDSVLSVVDGCCTNYGWIPLNDKESYIEMIFEKNENIESINLYYTKKKNIINIRDILQFAFLRDGMWQNINFDVNVIEDGFAKIILNNNAYGIRVKINNSSSSIKFINEIEVNRE